MKCGLLLCPHRLPRAQTCANTVTVAALLRRDLKLISVPGNSTQSKGPVSFLLVELKEHASEPTLAQKLGDAAHVSGLAIRLGRISGTGERLPEWLLKVAVGRGARHYQREFDPSLSPDNPAVTDEEIGIALCLEQHSYNLDLLRAAAQLLTSSRVDPVRLCRLAIQERCEPVLLHIAEIARKYAPKEEPWATLRKQLPPRPVPRTDALPHWTRLVSHSGVTRQGSSRTDWLSRNE